MLMAIMLVLSFLALFCLFMAFQSSPPTPYNDRTREIYSERLYEERITLPDGSERITTIRERNGERTIETVIQKRLTG